MISVIIMIIISTVVAGSQSRYTSGASLKNVANNIGLSIRQAQIYGISVKELTPGSEDFSVGYGLSFNTSFLGDNKAYIFFADRNGNGTYSGTWDCPISGSSECLDKTPLTAGNIVSDLCIIDSGGEVCNGIDKLDISFVRPAIEAKIYYNDGVTGVIGAKVILSSPDGRTNSVTVYTTGQVSIQ